MNLLIKTLFKRRQLQESKKSIHVVQDTAAMQIPLSMDLNENLQTLHAIYHNCSYVVFHDFLISRKTKALLIFIESLSDKEKIDEYVLAALIQNNPEAQDITKDNLQQIVPLANSKGINMLADVIEQVSLGNPVLLIDKEIQGIAFSLAKWEMRSIQEPNAEPVIKGPREGFTETLSVNMSLLLRKIKSPLFKMTSIKIGRYTQTHIMVAYIDGLADPTLIQEVMNRLERIELDGVLESGYIEEMIDDHLFSPFPMFLTTERPDSAAGQLLEGRAAILIDGTPSVIIVPTTLASLLQSPEDYYQRFIFATLIRWLRYMFVLVALFAPSVYIALLTYHQEMVPTTLLLTIAKSREEIPFPAFFEALLMEVTFEALREAGIRLPKQVGSAVSIVGALVIGQAATAAGLVSSPMVMVVAITGIASFMIPHYNAGISFRTLRFPIMILAGFLGLLGVTLGMIMIVIHLCTLRSFGVPYMSPFAPMKPKELKDALTRVPWSMMNTRPRLTGKWNKYRKPLGGKPGPDNGDDQDARKG